VSRYDFFIAYATPDRRQAERLTWYLQDDSCEVFLDEQVVRLGALWQPKVREALEASRVIVVLVSTHADDAFYQQEEIVRAIQLARDKSRAHTVIPVILEKLPQGAVSMPYGLSSLQAWDATRPGCLQRVAVELVAWLKERQLNANQPKVAGAMIDAKYGGMILDFLKDTFKEPAWLNLAPAKKKLIEQSLTKNAIYVYIDDLDRGWQGRREDNVRISALLNAVRDITTENRGIHFRISLRSDVYFLVRTSDESTDKIEGSVIWHTWTNHEIFVLLIKRIESFLVKRLMSQNY